MEIWIREDRDDCVRSRRKLIANHCVINVEKLTGEKRNKTKKVRSERKDCFSRRRRRLRGQGVMEEQGDS